LFVPAANRTLQTIQRSPDQPTRKAIAQEATQAADAGMQGGSRKLARSALNILFDLLAGELLQWLTVGQRVTQQGPHLGQMLRDGRRRQPADLSQVLPVTRQKRCVRTRLPYGFEATGRLQEVAEPALRGSVATAWSSAAKCSFQFGQGPMTSRGPPRRLEGALGPTHQALCVARWILMFAQPTSKAIKVFDVG
jgi:hypothetical protein